MFSSINEISEKFKIKFNNKDIKYEKDIISIFNGNIQFKTDNFIILQNIGLYYEYVKKDYDEMKKYYLITIELNVSGSINNLGYYYQYIEKDYDKIKKYYSK